jgi:hypothetical protein
MLSQCDSMEGGLVMKITVEPLWVHRFNHR